jgi:hemerythrin
MQMVENFRHEESLLRQVASTGQIHPHVRAHADISMRMSLAIDAYADNNTAMFLHRLTETLQVWLKHHLVKSDLPLAEPSLQTAHSASLNT